MEEYRFYIRPNLFGTAIAFVVLGGLISVVFLGIKVGTAIDLTAIDLTAEHPGIWRKMQQESLRKEQSKERETYRTEAAAVCAANPNDRWVRLWTRPPRVAAAYHDFKCAQGTLAD